MTNFYMKIPMPIEAYEWTPDERHFPKGFLKEGATFAHVPEDELGPAICNVRMDNGPVVCAEGDYIGKEIGSDSYVVIPKAELENDYFPTIVHMIEEDDLMDAEGLNPTTDTAI